MEIGKCLPNRTASRRSWSLSKRSVTKFEGYARTVDTGCMSGHTTLLASPSPRSSMSRRLWVSTAKNITKYQSGLASTTFTQHPIPMILLHTTPYLLLSFCFHPISFVWFCELQTLSVSDQFNISAYFSFFSHV